MKSYSIISALIILLFMLSNLSAQEMPLVYDVENTGAECPSPYLPTFSELPAIKALPDPFLWSDGRGRISFFSDWRYRRAEIKAEIEHYEIGVKPVRPDDITASYSNGTLTVNVTVNGYTLTLTSNISVPSGNGPFPAVIGIGFGGTGSLPSNIFTSRNIATIGYQHDQVSSYGNPQDSDPYFRLYPDFNNANIGQYSAWAWGVSRLIDGLELVQDVLPIDLKHIAVTGCSYAGKLALFAGALDERIALTISQESGGGGYTTWRYSEVINQTESVETLSKTDYNWFRNSMRDFSSNVSKLPHDHHELMAMVAPRALLVTGNPGWTWLADESGYVGSKAAKEVYKALSIPDRFGYSQIGGHNHCQVPDSQLPEIEAFVDKFLLGDSTANTNVSSTPYSTNLSSWITWDTPVLTEGTSFFGKTTLVHPPNLETDMDTSITLRWNKVTDAGKYIFQLSENSTFTDIVVSDTTADTSKTVNGLSIGTKYYWRVQVSGSGGVGPMSDFWNFSTAIALPGTPHLVSVTKHPSRTDYILLRWNTVPYASNYLVQFSTQQSFLYILSQNTTSDTSIYMNNVSEGKNYYWRVQARNIAGSGPWSETAYYTLIITPTDLEIQSNESGEVTLTWKDNSTVEDGYIIERKQGAETSFTIIDTLENNITEYPDNTITQSDTYTYRIKAFKGDSESDYSEEISATVTDVNDIPEVIIPAEYALGQNFPNPFNPSTKIKFALSQAGHTRITIYDFLGSEIRTIIDKDLPAGYHEVIVDAESFGSYASSGIYLYRIESGNFVSMRKMILMK
ncbi:MAG: T9SS type A sorting domain-containing protein [Melioribacteraceae bacterium]|nr:T9SS type A sorting domain-containing protein [Melioribacteraceae bacterium]